MKSIGNIETMKYTSLACALALAGLFSSSAMASGPIEIINGNLVVDLGDAPGNGSRRTIRLGNYGDEVNYASVSYTHLTLPTKRIV